MGLAIVGVEELLVNPYQRQVLSLQARPYQDDPVSGTLTLEVSVWKYSNRAIILLRPRPPPPRAYNGIQSFVSL